MPKDHSKDIQALDRHLHNTIQTSSTSSMLREMPHLGGAAALLEYMKRKHTGETHAIKKELKRAVDYMYYYETTKNSFYHKMAMDAIMHVRQLCDLIHDEIEKKEAGDFIADVEQALEAVHGGNPGGDMVSMPTANAPVTMAGRPY